MSKVGAKPLKSYGKVYWQIVVPHLGGWLLNIFEDVLRWPFQSFLRSPWGLKYIDDLFLLAKTYNLCVTNIIDTFMQFDSLEFTTHVEKSVFIPSKGLVVLRFIIDSVAMSITLTPDKAQSVKEACPKVRDIAWVIGKIISSFPGVPLCQIPKTWQNWRSYAVSREFWLSHATVRWLIN